MNGDGTLSLRLLKKDTSFWVDSAGYYVYHTWHYTSGDIHPMKGNFPASGNYRNTPFYFKYGYFEVKFKLPHWSNYEDSNAMFGRPFITGFWFYNGTDANYCSKGSEIDAFENHDYNMFWPNVHYQRYIQCPYINNVSFNVFDNFDHDNANQYNTTPESAKRNWTFSQWHTVGMEWMPDQVNFYYDGEFIASVSVFEMRDLSGNLVNQKYKPKDLTYQELIFEPSINTVKVNSLSKFPLDFTMDYFHFSELQLDTATAINSCGINFSSYDHKVKKSISINTTCNSPSIIYNTQNISLRAEEFVELNEGFEVQQGATFFANVTGSFK